MSEQTPAGPSETVCPRCGFRNSFQPSALPGSCECRVCLSQLDWRDIPGCGPDCLPAAAPESPGVAPGGPGPEGGS